METAIISGKGGTGKSSIAAAFATIANNVLVVDCDVDAANLYLLFDPVHEEEVPFVGSYKAVIEQKKCTQCRICISYCRFDAIYESNGKVIVSETDCDGCFLCSRICPEHAVTMHKNDNSRMYAGTFRNGRMVYGWLAPGEENSGKLVHCIREKAKELAQKHGLVHTILDGPPGIGCPVVSTITGTNNLIIVTESSVSALHDMNRVLELADSFHIPSMVVINKSDINPEITVRIEQICATKNIEIIGRLHFDPLFTQAMIHGKSIYEWAPDSASSKELVRMWHTISTTQLLSPL
jgi:MinD superfamily P-loop ATPase